MWVEELPNGKFKYVERYTHPLTGKQKKVSLTNTKRNARVEKEMFIKLQEKINALLQTSSADIDFRTLTKKWQSVYKKQVKQSTFNNNKSYMNTINQHIGDILLDKLTAAHINNMILDMFDKGYAYGTVKAMVSFIRKSLVFGLKYGYLKDRSVLYDIELPSINVPDKDDFKYLERDELQQVVEQLEANGRTELARMCLIQTYTGMRYGEMISLDYSKHIDFKNKTILIERTWYHRKRMFQLPKNKKPRTIHFNKNTEELLRDQIKYTMLKIMRFGLDKTNKLLFINQKGQPFNNSYANELLGKLVSVPGKHVTTHIFRHTFVSLMVEQGYTSNLIARHVGHSNTDMVEKVYSHFTKKMDTDLMNAINDFDLNHEPSAPFLPLTKS